MPRTKKVIENQAAAPAPEVPKEVPVVVAPNDFHSLDNENVKVDRPSSGDAQTMFAHLASQKKVTTVVPLEGSEKLGKAFHTVILNGLRFNILKGKFAEVPQQIAEVIKDAFYQTQVALQGKTVNPFSGQVHNSKLEGDLPPQLR